MRDMHPVASGTTGRGVLFSIQANTWQSQGEKDQKQGEKARDLRKDAQRWKMFRAVGI